jgi:hypothetical protein
MFQKIKNFLSKVTTEEIKYCRPTLRISFLDGDVKEAVPHLWHRGFNRNWQLYYAEDGVLLNRFPLAAIKEVEVISVEEATITAYGDPIWVPIYATAEEIEKKIFRKRRFGG